MTSFRHGYGRTSRSGADGRNSQLDYSSTRIPVESEKENRHHTSLWRARFLKTREINSDSPALEPLGLHLRRGVKYLAITDQFLRLLDIQEGLFVRGYQSQTWEPAELYGYVGEYYKFFQEKFKEFRIRQCAATLPLAPYVEAWRKSKAEKADAQHQRPPPPIMLEGPLLEIDQDVLTDSQRDMRALGVCQEGGVVDSRVLIRMWPR